MKHGEERNRRQVTADRGATEFLNATTGEVLLRGATVSHTRTVYDRWCEGCQKWVVCDGLTGSLKWSFEHEQHRVPEVP